MKSTLIHPESDPALGRKRGSALLLVIVSLTLMAMLGAAYIQMARVDRLSTREILNENHIDSVVESVLSHIQSTLSQDVLDDNGNFFNPGNTNNGGGDESHDYPFTANVTWQVQRLDGTTLLAKGGQNDDTWLASTAPNFGPDALTSDDVWSHITNLNGIFLRNVGNNPMPTEDLVNLTGTNNTDTDIRIPADNDPDWVDADGDGIKDSRWTWAPVLKIGDVMYVMAVRIIDNSSLININAATAMTSDGLNGWGGTATAPRGFFPTEIDLSRLLSRSIGPVNSFWDNELEDLQVFPNSGLLNARGISGIPTPFGLSIPSFTAIPGGRLDAWWFNTSLYGDPTNKFSIDDELELRFGGGLNNPHNTSPVEEEMPTTLISNNTATAYNDNDPPGDLIASTPYQYFRGIAQTLTPTLQIQNHVFPAIRHMLTTTSGAAVFAPNHDGVHTGAAPVLKYDLVYQDGGSRSVAPLVPPDPIDPTRTNQYARFNNIAQRLNTIFTISGPGFSNGYLQIQTDVLGQTLLNQIAHEFALAIQDYSDTDSAPSWWTDPNSGITHYGMEMLPFLREVYIQAEYDNADELDALGQPGTDGLFETYTFHTDSQAMAIELGNPFERPIPGALLDNRVRIVVVQSGVDGDTYTFAGIAPNIASHGKVIVYSNQETTVPGGGAGTNLVGALDLLAPQMPRVQLPDGMLKFNMNDDVSVKLQVNVGAGNWVTYDRLTVGGLQLPTSRIQPNPTNLAATPAYGQGSMFRPCTNSTGGTPSVHYLSNINKGLVAPGVRLPDESGYQVNRDRLTADNKGTNGHVMFDNFQLPLADRQFMSVAELGWIHMFGFYDDPNDATAGDFPQRLSGLGLTVPFNPNVTSTQNPSRWTLHFREVAWPEPGNASIAVAVWDNNGIPPFSGIPHAGMVMDQFTTLSPRHDNLDNDFDDLDGIDNDNDTLIDELDEHPTHLQSGHLVHDGIDNDQDGFTDEDDEAEFLEQFVPGTININTVPLHIATLAAPLPENVGNVQSLMEAIADYRERYNSNVIPNRSSYTGIPQIRTRPGIASIGELMFINPPTNGTIETQFGNLINNNAYQMQRYGNNGNPLPIPSEINLYPLPERQPTPYNPVDSAEEALARFQFLSQVFTTRSDIFTAYVVIQGFPANDMSSNKITDNGVTIPIPIESIRFFAVFDRSNITSNNDQPRILGVYGLD